MATSNRFPVTDLDFNQIKEGLIEYLKGQEQFKDYNFEGSNLNVLLDILSYNTFQNNFYNNMAISEMFLDSAQLRESVVSHSKELNYLPRSKTSAKAIVDITLNTFGNPPFVVIPEKTKFVAICGNETYSFFNQKSETVFPSNGTYTFSGLEIYEGQYITERFTPSNSLTQKYLISNEDIDLNSVRVKVIENDFTKEYVYSSDLYGLKDSSEVFFIQPYVGERYEIFFGQDIFGVEPKVGSVIEVEYRIASGSVSNGITSYEIQDNIQGYGATVTLRTASRGGSEREDLSSIKYFAPKSIQVQERAVTVKDYEVLMKRRFPEVKTVAVYGGETLSPPQYGRVVISVALQDFSNISFTKREEYRTFLKERCSLTIEPIIVPSEFAYFDISTRVTYNRSNTSKSVSDIQKTVQEAVLNFSNENLGDFKKTLRFSKLEAAIDDSDDNILSNETIVKLVIEIQPVPSFTENFTIEFGNRLFVPSVSSLSSTNIQTQDAGLISSAFTFRNKNAYLRDNGQGSIDIITNAGQDITYLRRNAGTINYTTGTVKINSLEIDGYIGDSIKLFAKPFSKDVISPKERVSLIRSQDITISVIGTTE